MTRTITDEQYEFFLLARTAFRFHGEPEGPGRMRTAFKAWCRMIHAERDAERAAERRKEAA